MPYPTTKKRNPAFRSMGLREGRTVRSSVRSNTSVPLRRVPPADAATSRVPVKAMAIPTEHMRRYFHMASKAPGVGWMQIRKAVRRVVDSIPTQRRPRLLEIKAKTRAPKDPNQRPV